MDRERAQVMFVIAHVFMYICIFVCFFEDFSRLRLHSEPKVIPYSRVADNTLLRHIFGAMVFPARASWHVIVVPIGLTIWSWQLPSKFHMILDSDSSLHKWGIKENQRYEFSGSPVRKKRCTFNSHGHRAEGTKRETVVRMSIGNPVHREPMDAGL